MYPAIKGKIGHAMRQQYIYEFFQTVFHPNLVCNFPIDTPIEDKDAKWGKKGSTSTQIKGTNNIKKH